MAVQQLSEGKDGILAGLATGAIVEAGPVGLLDTGAELPLVCVLHNV